MRPFFGMKDVVDISKFVEINDKFVGKGGDIFDIIEFLDEFVWTGEVISICGVIGELGSLELSEIVSCCSWPNGEGILKEKLTSFWKKKYFMRMFFTGQSLVKVKSLSTLMVKS